MVYMSDIFICKHCGKEMGIKQFGRHLWKIHQQKYEDYVKDNLHDFRHLGWKNCLECNEVFKGTSDKCGKCYTKNHKIKEDQYIQCKNCQEKIHSKVFSQHLKVYHNIEFRTYVKDNLNDFKKFGWCNCVICGNVTKKQGDKQETTCSEKCLSEYRKTLVGEKSARYGALLSDKTKEKISVSQIKRFINPENHPFYGKHHKQESKEKISHTRIELGLSKGKNNPMYGKTHTPEAIAKIFSHRKMNKLEALVAEQFDKAFIPYHFQYFINENGVCKSYDFKIDGKPLIIEVDGDFWHGNPNHPNPYNKSDTVRENDRVKDELAKKRGFQVIRLWESDIKKDPSIVLKYVL